MLNPKKSVGHDEIPPKIIKLGAKHLAPSFTKIVNNCADQCVFPASMKMAEISPVFKKNGHLPKDNYRPVSILSTFSSYWSNRWQNSLKHISRFYLTNMYLPIGKDIAVKLYYWTLLTSGGLLLIKTSKNKFCVGALFMELSKSFNCMPHALLMSKLYAYGVTPEACQLICNYLRKRVQRTKVGVSRSPWAGIRCATRQRIWPYVVQYFFL